MRNNTSLLWVLLLVHGVFGDTDAVKSVSVMEGDSVTLNPDFTDIQRDDTIKWKFGSTIIAHMNEANAVFSTHDGPDGSFRDRLKLDKQTGSLTITNIKTEHVGLYSVDIKDKHGKLKTFQVTVHDDVVSVSVMEGDTVTLHTGVTDKQRDDVIQWKFGDQDLNGPVDPTDQSGDLIIRNIRIDQSGDYKLEINTSNMILHRKFSIAVGGMKKISVKEGESVILHTGVTEIQGYDLILWKIEDNVIADINERTKLFQLHDRDNERFKGRLQMHHQSGSLIISDSETSDSGDYHLNMDSSSHTINRTISVTVKRSGRSGAVSGISGASVGLMVWAVTFFLLQEV